jgi:hypothetical protein
LIQGSPPQGGPAAKTPNYSWSESSRSYFYSLCFNADNRHFRQPASAEQTVLLSARPELVATLICPWLGSIQLTTAGIGSRWGSSVAAVAVDNLRELSPAVGGESDFPIKRR